MAEGPFTITTDVTPTPPNFFNNDDKADILWRNENGDVELWNSNSGTDSLTGQDLGVVKADPSYSHN
jgi:hypothetical protein